MPLEFSVALRARDVLTVSASAILNSLVFSPIEYLGRTPQYMDELYAIYRYSRVTAITINAIVTNLGTAPVEVAIATMPYNDISSITLEKVIERPGSVRRLVSKSGGMDRATLTKTVIAEQAFGNPYLDRDFWIDSSQAASTTPLDSREPVTLVSAQSIDGTGASVIVEVRTTYHVQFFDLRSVAST
jgi:hypothetical protein